MNWVKESINRPKLSVKAKSCLCKPWQHMWNWRYSSIY